MTDDDRERLCQHLRRVADMSMEAAKELEWLTAENGRLTQALIDKTATPKIREQPRSEWIIRDD